MLKAKEIGIDLGSKSIKVAIVDKLGGSNSSTPNLNHLKEHEVYKVHCEPYTDAYYQVLKECIKDFAKKNKLKFLSINISIPVDKVKSNISFINMPIVGDKLLDDGIAFEAEEKMALEGIRNSHYTWKISNEYEDLSEYEIMLATIEKDVINALASFKTIMWKINRVLLQPVLLERIVSSNDVIIDLGHEFTRVYLYTEGKLAKVEIIELGGQHFLNSINDYIKENEISNVNHMQVEDIIKLVSIHNENLKDDFFIEDNVEEEMHYEEQEYNNIELPEIDVQENLYNEEDLYIDEEIENNLENNLEDNLEDDVVPNVILEEAIVENLIESDDEINIENEFESEELIDEDLNDSEYENEFQYEIESALETEVDNEDNIEELHEIVSEPLIKDVKNDEVLYELSKVISVKADKLIDEIKRIVRMFELQNGLDMDEIYYVGELSRLTYFKESIEAELDIELKPVDILDRDDEDISPTLYSIAGLVSMDPELKDNTNFSKYIKANIDYTSITVALLALSLSVGVSFKMINTKYDVIIGELNETRFAQNETIDQIDRDVRELEESINANDKFINRMDALSNEKKWLSDILYVIPDRTPLTIAIKELDIIDKQVIIRGYSANYSSVGFFANELENIGEVKIESIRDYNNQDGEIYSVTMEDADLTSDKFKATKFFNITLSYNDELLSH